MLDDLVEARAIAAGQSVLRPERRHLEALVISALYWRALAIELLPEEHLEESTQFIQASLLSELTVH